jgi:hypothetical protein
MSGKSDKKIRQMYRRDFQSELNERVEALVPKLKKVIKKPPRYFPVKLWYWIAVHFINLE